MLISIILTLIVSCTLYFITNIATKFFRDADAIEGNINEATTHLELEDIYNNELIPLSKRSFHSETSARLRELDAIIRTKYKYIKK